jgi:hypothetical protein
VLALERVIGSHNFLIDFSEVPKDFSSAS